MGQSIGVTERPGARGGMVRFDLNRSLTGMGHVRHHAGDEIVGDDPPSVLARRFFATGKVAAIHMYMNQVTVELEVGADSSGLADIVEHLYRFYDDDGPIDRDADDAAAVDAAAGDDAAPEPAGGGSAE